MTPGRGGLWGKLVVIITLVLCGIFGKMGVKKCKNSWGGGDETFFFKNYVG